jgi:hypothetical protein
MKEKSEDEEDCVERRMKKNRMKIEAEYRGMKWSHKQKARKNEKNEKNKAEIFKKKKVKVKEQIKRI